MDHLLSEVHFAGTTKGGCTSYQAKLEHDVTRLLLGQVPYLKPHVDCCQKSIIGQPGKILGTGFRRPQYRASLLWTQRIRARRP